MYVWNFQLELIMILRWTILPDFLFIYIHVFFSIFQIEEFKRAGSEGNASFKFEPFILHTQCRSLEDAQMMVRQWRGQSAIR